MLLFIYLSFTGKDNSSPITNANLAILWTLFKDRYNIAPMFNVYFNTKGNMVESLNVLTSAHLWCVYGLQLCFLQPADLTSTIISTRKWSKILIAVDFSSFYLFYLFISLCPPLSMETANPPRVCWRKILGHPACGTPHRDSLVPPLWLLNFNCLKHLITYQDIGLWAGPRLGRSL